MERKKKISVTSSCYNEVGNIQNWYDRIVGVLRKFPQYDYEMIIADNCSTDGTRDLLRRIAASDKNFKVIFNANNFGQIRSPYNAFTQATGDAAVMMVSDLQEPPELIAEMIERWEQGYDVVIGTKSASQENWLMAKLRKLYYGLLSRISDSDDVIQQFTGFGLYDKKFISALKKVNHPNPYFRGLVSKIGFKRAEIHYVQAKRTHGKSKNNFFSLYDYAMNGLVNHSSLPLRLATLAGFILAGLSLLVALVYLVYKLLFWNTFSVGISPLVIGLFFFSAIQLIFIGIIGEYVGGILTQVKNFPVVIEDEKLNFDK